MNIYGVVNSDGVHIDVSKSEKGAKQYATRHGYSKVSIRFHSGYTVVIISEKNKSGKWVGFAEPKPTN